MKTKLLVSLAIAAFSMIASNLVKALRRPREKFTSVQYSIDFSAAQALKHAKKKGIELDFSVDSLSFVESMLGDLHDKYKANKQSVSVGSFAGAYGAYVGEVIRRTEPESHWEKDSAIGKSTYPLHWRGGEVFPIGWCVKRIEDGAEDNILVKYQMFLKLRDNKGSLNDA